MKRVIKAVILIIACVTVGIYLYSHKHAEYSMESQQRAGDQSDEKGNDALRVITIPDHFEKKVSKLLTFDTKVIISESFIAEGFQESLAYRENINTDIVCDYFMGGRTGISSTVYESYFDAEGYKTPITVYEDGGKSLSISEYDFIYYKSPQMNYIHNSFFADPSIDNYNEFLYSKESNLDFMDRNSAWSEIVKTMNTLGVDMSSAVAQVTYSLDMETMREEENCKDLDGNEITEEKNPNWSQQDEGYYYYITQNYQGIPFYAGRTIEIDEEYVAPLEIFQTEKEVIFVNLKRWFRVEKQEGMLEFMPFEKVMSTVEEKYSGTIHTNPLVVEKAKLYVFPIQTGEGVYTLTPVWVCTIVENHVDLGADAYKSNIYMAVNAITGEEMPILEI